MPLVLAMLSMAIFQVIFSSLHASKLELFWVHSGKKVDFIWFVAEVSLLQCAFFFFFYWCIVICS